MVKPKLHEQYKKERPLQRFECGGFAGNGTAVMQQKCQTGKGHRKHMVVEISSPVGGDDKNGYEKAVGDEIEEKNFPEMQEGFEAEEEGAGAAASPK